MEILELRTIVIEFLTQFVSTLDITEERISDLGKYASPKYPEWNPERQKNRKTYKKQGVLVFYNCITKEHKVSGFHYHVDPQVWNMSGLACVPSERLPTGWSPRASWAGPLCETVGKSLLPSSFKLWRNRLFTVEVWGPRSLLSFRQSPSLLLEASCFPFRWLHLRAGGAFPALFMNQICFLPLPTIVYWFCLWKSVIILGSPG